MSDERDAGLTPSAESLAVGAEPKTTAAEPLSRRGAIGVAVAVAGVAYLGGISYPIYKYLATAAELSAAEETETEVTVAGAETLAPGASTVFKFAGRPGLLIHQLDGTWTAFNAVCTHLGCTVAYEPDKSRIHCACHGGVYDLKTGAVVSGPPPKGLQVYSVAVTAEKVVVPRA